MTEEDDINGEDAERARIAEFALGLLPADEHRAMARRIAGDPALGRELTLWRQRLSAFDGEFVEEAPPQRVYSSIERRLFAPSPAAASTGGFWDSLRFWRSLTGAMAAVALGAVALNLMTPQTVNPEQFAVQLVAALEAQEGFGVEWVALYDSDNASVRLVSLSGEAVPDRDFELWYIPENEAAVSMGVIPVNERTEIQLDAATQAKFTPGTVLAVTLEPVGGSPTGVATGPIVAAGPAAAI